MPGLANIKAIFQRIAPWIVVLLPALIIARCLRVWLVNVPFMDDYVWMPLYEKIAAGKFHFNDFFFVQMEHRLTVPAFVMWLCFHLSPGNIALHYWISFAQIVITVFNLCFILRRTAGRLRGEWLILALTSFLFFSPTQFTTLMWGDCISSFMPVLFLTSALALFHSRLKAWPKIVACLLCAVLGTHSFASGILIWFLMAPLILWSDALPDARTKKLFFIVWTISFAITMFFYFHGLTNQAEPEFSYEQGKEETLGKHVSAFLSNPLASTKFVLLFTGAMLGRGTFAGMKSATLLAGSLCVIVLIAAAIYVWRRKDVALRRATLPWLLLGVYTVGTGAMVALGRIWATAGLDGALWGRYTTHAAPVSLAVCVLVWLIMRDVRARFPKSETTARNAGAVLLGGMIVITGIGWVYGMQMMEAWSSSRLRDATSQMFSKVLHRSLIQGPVTGNMEFGDRMDNLGALRPPMCRMLRLDQFEVINRKANVRVAKLDEIVFINEPQPLKEGAAATSIMKLQVSGYAFQPGMDRVADGVFITRRDPQQGWVIIAVAQVKQQPLLLNEVMGPDSQYLHQPFRSFRDIFGFYQIRISAAAVPEGPQEIAAWAFDFKHQIAWPVSGRFEINTKTREVQQTESDEALLKKKTR